MEKYRQFWVFDDLSLSVVIDSVPFGDYLEARGGREEIEKLINDLELGDYPHVTDAYIVEYSKYCVDNNLKEEKDIVFFKN